ncbi:hypothetical protein EPA93_37680 [Ktedonosporobacter rubrisoli]|uniref:Uncharacterized protein n=1 Tax=Ktedonosporobacter rubrisoli TaxID=2509675 RepID=A0A4P6K170_KTERU|nr:hypothetical protein [Ktedonosporobacter rubrisoli]QBD81400.1 hypothetical protein EPA93_37680 [Ktedonosporobacter rubrisoli]
MAETFAELYKDTLKDVFLKLAQEQLAQGADGLTCADAYAEQGKPEFALAYLLLTDMTDEAKRDIFARSYEQRASISELKADEFSSKYHRPFTMIKMEARKDRTAARRIRKGQSLPPETKSLFVS